MAKLTKSSYLTPIIFIALYIMTAVILRIIFPTGQALVDQLASIYGRFGYEIIILGSFLEALVLVNFFTPGVAAVGLGAIFAKSGELDLSLAIIFAVLGSIVGYMLDFLLGRFGFGELINRLGYKGTLEDAKSKLLRFSVRTIGLAFMHPNVGALVSLAAGILRMDFRRFFLLALLSTLVWYILWGILIYSLGQIFLTILTKYISIIFILVGAAWLLMTIYGQTKEHGR